MNQASVKHTRRYLAFIVGGTSGSNALSLVLRTHQAKRRL